MLCYVINMDNVMKIYLRCWYETILAYIQNLITGHYFVLQNEVRTLR